MYQRILVPLDGSRAAEVSLRLASSIARPGRAEITLLRVVEYPCEIYTEFTGHRPFLSGLDPASTIQLRKDAVRQEAEDYLRRTANGLAVSSQKVTTQVTEGPVVESILRAAETARSDLIVLSTCGQGGGSPWILGSVASRLLRESPVPVLLVRPGLLQSADQRRRASVRRVHPAFRADRYGSRAGITLTPADRPA